MTSLEILDYDDSLAADFQRINVEWIEAMFTMEANDRAILDNPRQAIVDRGGLILFVRTAGGDIVGTCALISIGEGVYELTKMGVSAAARGSKAGEFLLRAVLDRAAALRMRSLYLLTNARCEAAIHLYEKLGFVHDPEIMAHYGVRYQRCNVAMSYPLPNTRFT